jgi:hypothetical protein
MKGKWFFIVPLAIMAMLLCAVIGGEVVMRLWNWLLPPLLAWRQINFWQALGLLTLCRILFGGSRWSSSGRYNFRRCVQMQMPMKDGCKPGTPEQREQFRQRVREFFGFGPSNCESKAH